MKFPGGAPAGDRPPLSEPRLAVPVWTIHLAALAVALGPPLLFGVAVAPAAFRLLPTRHLAATLVSPVLSTASALAGAAFLALFATSWYLGRHGAPRLVRVLATRVSILGFFAALVIRELLIPPIDRIREEAPGLIDTLPVADPSRILLDRYHRLATGLFAGQVLAAVIMLLLTARLAAWRPAVPSAPAAATRPVPKLLDLSDV